MPEITTRLSFDFTAVAKVEIRSVAAVSSPTGPDVNPFCRHDRLARKQRSSLFPEKARGAAPQRSLLD
jgi:hypothetical protein